MQLPKKLWYTNHFFCDKCDTLTDKLSLFNDHHINNHLFDCFMFWHVIGGIFLGLVLKRFDYVMIANILFEIIENSFIGVTVWIKSGVSNKIERDTYMNIIGDTLSVIVGFCISKRGFRISMYAVGLMLLLFFTVPMFLEKSETRKEILNVVNKYGKPICNMVGNLRLLRTYVGSLGFPT